ncbi:hypothetical protein JCM10908_003208 [Rhodotorula pacifica]|uniref:alpha/beta fold hydrolase n=1 Tax=Rhodotorula pacifica TaxID=1495444 RepID=UPI0031801B1E
MPHLDLPGGVRMHYERFDAIHTPEDAASATAPLQTLVVLVPFTSSPLSTLPQLAATSPLRKNYDIIALAPRSHGETTAPITAESDHFVAAAELAFAYEALQIPPCPLFAPSTICSRIALAFTILFPDLVTALALASLSTRSARRSIAQLVGFCELAVGGEDSELVIEMFAELASILGGDGQTDEQKDRLVKFLLRQGGPRKTRLSYERMGLWYYEAKFPSHVLAAVRQPCLLLYGENDEDTLPENDNWELLLNGAQTVRIELIPDTSKMCWIAAPQPVSDALASFFDEHAHRSESQSAPPQFEQALTRLATISHEPGVRDRDLRDPQSFAALTKQEVQERADALRRVEAAEELWCAQHEGPDPWEVPSPRSSVEGDDEQNPRWSPRDEENKALPSPTSLVSPPLVSETVTVEVAVLPAGADTGAATATTRKQSVVSVENED